MKSGFVALIGRSNVGKSTLLNTLVGTKISATSFRPQMTRHIIHGALNSPEGQAIFVDTPGLLKERKSRLTARLQHKVEEALQEIDLIIYVVDPTRDIGAEERSIFGMIRHLRIPKILVLNKSDLPKSERVYQQAYEAWAKDFDSMFLLSALKARHIQPLKEKVFEFLKEGEPFYLDDQLTNIDNYFWIAEIIREKVFSVFDKELPYSMNVEIDNVEEKIKDKEMMTIIQGRILTNQDRFKKFIIGKNGNKIKEIGIMARREIEASINRKVFLELEVEVDPHWVERI